MPKFFSFFKPIASGPYWGGLSMMLFGIAQLVWQVVLPLALTQVVVGFGLMVLGVQRHRATQYRMG